MNSTERIDNLNKAPGPDPDAPTRNLLKDIFKKFRKSRMQIADEMGALLNCRVTKEMLDAFTAESNRSRFPQCFSEVFCQVVGEDRLGMLAVRKELRNFTELGKGLHAILKTLPNEAALRKLLSRVGRTAARSQKSRAPARSKKSHADILKFPGRHGTAKARRAAR